MSFSQDDLTPLIFPKQKESLAFHQGVIQAWNAETGENTVNVAGAFIKDLPILNTSEAIALKVGHVVGILRFRSTYFILGRITVPGDAQFASASVAFAEGGAEAVGFAVTTTLTPVVGANITVPAWADEAIVYLSGFTNLRNSRNAPATADFADFVVGIEGGGGGGARQGFAALGDAGLGDYGNLAAQTVELLDADFLADGLINIQGRISSIGANWPFQGDNYMVIHALVVFRSII